MVSSKYSGELTDSLSGSSIFCSWSGGKDSCLALYNAVRSGAQPKSLITMFIEDGVRTRSHGLDRAVIEAQADSLGISLITRNCSWSTYEKKFVEAAQECRETDCTHGVFGDINIEPNRLWEEKVCAAAMVEPCLPLWKKQRGDHIHEFIEAGFTAYVAVVHAEKLPKALLGRKFDEELIEEFKAARIDLSGEEGEYHTVVVDGPLFDYPVSLQAGETVLRSGYWFLDFRVM